MPHHTAQGKTLASIVEQLTVRTEQHPNKLLYGFLDINGALIQSYTYAQFVQRVADIALHLQRAAPSPAGTRVLLVYPPGLEMIAAFFACARLGLIPVPVYPPPKHNVSAALQRMAFVAQDSGAQFLLTDRSCFWLMKWAQAKRQLKEFSFKKDVIGQLKWVVSTDAVTNGAGRVQDAHSDILFLQYTSGSTHNPKGVMVTHDGVLANCTSAVDHDPISVSWLPQYHDMGLIGYYLFPAVTGGSTYGFSPIDFLQRPALWLEAMSRYRATTSAAPDFAYGYCLRCDKVSDEVLDGLDLSSIEFLANAAEPVRPENFIGFRDRFARCGLKPEAFFSSYGLAEYTLVVSQYGRTVERFDAEQLGQRKVVPVAEGEGSRETKSLVSCGPPLPCTTVKIVEGDDGFRECAEGEVGEIWVQGPSMGLGYWKRPELSAEAFGATLPAEDGAWLRTGDLGFFHEGELYICGRIKDLIILRGRNYYPQDIEQIAEGDAGIRKGCTAAFSVDRDGEEALVVVAELKDRNRVPVARNLNQRLLAELGVVATTWVFIRRQTIDKTSSGKIRRHRVHAAFLSGRLSVIEQMDGDAPLDIESMDPNHPLAGLFQKYRLTGNEDLTLMEAGLDSVELAAFAQDLERILETAGSGVVEQAVDLRLLQKIRVVDLFNLLDLALEANPVALLRFRKALIGLEREHRDIEAQMMLEDATVRPDSWSLPAAHESRTGGGVLLTGGTGFLGPFLVHSLLEQCEDALYVLVRGEHEDAARSRLLAGLQRIGRTPTGEQLERLHVVCGDLSRPGLGLSREDWETLSTNIHTIYHNGAIVNYLYNYDAMRDTNVLGTRELVRLAFSKRAKVFNHISSTFVFGWSTQDTLPETYSNHDLSLLDFGYSQTKWVSEQIVQGALRCGLQGRIYRPALISPSLIGEGADADIAIRLLSFMLKYRFGTTASNQVSFIPVDQVAHNTVAISQLDDSLGKTYHVTRDDYASLADVTNILGKITDQSIELLDLDGFVDAVLERCTKDDPLFPLLNFFVRSTDNMKAMSFKRYENSEYQAARAAAGCEGDSSFEEVVRGIYIFMERQGLVDVSVTKSSSESYGSNDDQSA